MIFFNVCFTLLFFYLAIRAGRKQQQITEQILMNHFIFTPLHNHLSHLFTQKYNLHLNSRLHVNYDFF